MKKPAGIVRATLVLLCLSLGILMLLNWFERSQVYHPSRSRASGPEELGEPFKQVWLETKDGVRLWAWYFPSQTGWAAVHCHGNAGNITHRLHAARALLEAGVGVLLLDYRGYGESQGRPSEEGTYLDAQAGYDWLLSQGIPAERIIAFGESLGGAVACELAIREPCAGLVLQSSFTSVPDLGAELFPFLPVRWLSRIRYDTLSKLPGLKIPVLVLHSRSDELIRFTHAERNFAVIKAPKLLIELAGGHNDLAGESLVNGMKQFLEMLQTRGGGADSPKPGT